MSQLNHYVTLGRSGLRVSPLCLGAMTFGEESGWGSSPAEAQAIMDQYIDAGGNFIDTANAYTFGHSEHIIGDHVGRHPSKRDRLVLATKFSSNLFPKDPNGGGSGRKAIIDACEHSLRRLQTDYIDLYWLHVYDRNTPIEETLRAMDDLVRSGKVRYLGISDTPAWKVTQAQMLAEFRGLSPIIALQIEYNLIERSVEGELIPAALELGMGVTPWSPLKSGILSGKYARNSGNKADRGNFVEAHLNDRTFDIVETLVQVAHEAESTPARVALAWLLGRPGVDSVIIGARRLDQLKDNLACLDLKLSDHHRKVLDQASHPNLNFPADFLQRAGSFIAGGLTINGETHTPFIAPEEIERFRR